VDARVKPAHDGDGNPMRASIMIRITKIKYLGGYRLDATFSDGTAGEHNFSVLVARERPDGRALARSRTLRARIP
jgi:hypothetical protein